MPANIKRAGSEPPRVQESSKQLNSMNASKNISHHDFRQVIKNLTQIEDLLEAKLFDLREIKDFVSTVSVHSSLELKQTKKVLELSETELNDQNNRISSSKKNKYIVKYTDGKVQQINIENYLICLVCLEPMQKPATLPCGHTFCSICIQQASQQWSPKRCPLCKQQFSRFPNININTEQQIFNKLRISQQALQGDLVQVLVTENRIQAFTFGIVERIFDGFVGQDMATLVDYQLIEDEQEGFIPTKIALVNTGMRLWTGKISDVRVCKPQQYVLGTRLIRGSLVIHQKNIQVLKDTEYVCCDLKTYNSVKKTINQDRATPVNFNNQKINKQAVQQTFNKPPVRTKQTPSSIQPTPKQSGQQSTIQVQTPQTMENKQKCQNQQQNNKPQEANKEQLKDTIGQQNTQKLPQLNKPSKFAQFRQQQLEKMKQQKANQNESIAVDIFVPDKQKPNAEENNSQQQKQNQSTKNQGKAFPKAKSPALQQNVSPINSKTLQTSPQVNKVSQKQQPKPNNQDHENQTPNILKSPENDMRKENNDQVENSLMQTLPNRSLIMQINQHSYMNSIKPMQDPKPKQVQKVQTPTNQVQSVLNQQIQEFKQRMIMNSNNLLKDDFIYDPDIPKQQPPIFTPYGLKNPELVSILLFDEVISDQHTLFSTAMNKYDSQELNQYLRLVSDFTDFVKYPHFCCNGCKQLLRLPVTLKCGCQYCYTCAISLNNLDQVNKCLGCGAILTKEDIDIQQQINKQLVMKMYAKIPRHSPQIDKGIPVRSIQNGKIGILLDDPERVNVWVMFGPKQAKYLHINEIQAVNMCGLQLALRITEGLAYYKGRFVFLKANTDVLDVQQNDESGSQAAQNSSWQIYDLDNYNGYQISATDSFYYQCFRPVEDVRQQLFTAKQEGKRLQAKFAEQLKCDFERQFLREEHKVKEQRQQEIDKQLDELLKADSEEIPKNKPPSKFAHVKSSYAQGVAPQKKPKDTEKLAKIKEVQKQQLMEKEIKERQKKLGLKPFKQADLMDLRRLAAPGQIPEAQSTKNVEGLSPAARYFTSTEFKSKPPLVQLCYRYPDFNFLCSACWNVLKRPMTLKCGHIVCRTCACIYQASGQHCLLCKGSTGAVLDLQEDADLKAQLFKMDETYTDRQLDVGSFVCIPDDNGRLGIVRGRLTRNGATLLDVVIGDNTSHLTPPSALRPLAVNSVLDGGDVGVGSPVMVRHGALRGLLGLVIRPMHDQRGIVARRLRHTYNSPDDTLILLVTLETGYPTALPIDALRKVLLHEVEMEYTHYQNEVEKESIQEREKFKNQVKEYIQQITDEERANLMKKHFGGNTQEQKEQKQGFKNIWEKKS